MFDDPKKELEELEKKLLNAENDAWLDAQLAEAYALLGDTPAMQGTVASARGTARPVPDPSGPVSKKPAAPAAPVAPVKKKKKADWLTIVILVELLGIGGLAAYWAVMFLN